eukprot:7441279-Pyramimonas_sp.AAC.1
MFAGRELRNSLDCLRARPTLRSFPFATCNHTNHMLVFFQGLYNEGVKGQANPLYNLLPRQRKYSPYCRRGLDDFHWAEAMQQDCCKTGTFTTCSTTSPIMLYSDFRPVPPQVLLDARNAREETIKVRCPGRRPKGFSCVKENEYLVSKRKLYKDDRDCEIFDPAIHAP